MMKVCSLLSAEGENATDWMKAWVEYKEKIH